MRSMLSVCLSFVLSVCEQDYCKSNQPISWKLGVMIEHTNHKNWLTFGGNPVPDTDSGSPFHSRHHCAVGVFRRFISISHTVNGWFSRHSAKWLTDADDEIMNDEFRNPDSNPGSLLVDVRRLGGGLRSLSTVCLSLLLLRASGYSGGQVGYCFWMRLWVCPSVVLIVHRNCFFIQNSTKK